MSGGAGRITVSEGLTVECRGVDRSRCLELARPLDEGLQRISAITGAAPRILAIIVKGPIVLALSAAEIFREFNGVVALDASKPLGEALFSALHSAALSALAKRGMRGPVWLVEV